MEITQPQSKIPNPVVHVEKSRGKAEMVLPLSLSFCCCSRRKAFNGAEEIARERQREERREQKQNGMRQIERPESRTKEGKINSMRDYPKAFTRGSILLKRFV